MMRELIDYIEKGRKQGASFDEIALKLEAHGWNPYLVEHGIKKVQAREDKVAVNNSIWYVVGIFVVVVAVVYGAAWYGWGPTAEVFCVKPGVFGNIKEHDFLECCAAAQTCIAGETYTLRDKMGNVVFASNVHCATPAGEFIVRGDVAARC